MTTGFPQGGVLSAKFWAIAFDPAVEIINKYGILGNAFADDYSAILTGTHVPSILKILQKMLDELTAWGRNCGLTFNPQKTVVVLFSRK